MFGFYKTLPSLNRLLRTSLHQSSHINNISISAPHLKKFSFTKDQDQEVILLSSNGTEERMKYSEVLEKVGNRKLVRIQKTKTKKVPDTLQTFQIMSEKDLEIATKKEKAIPSTYLGSRTFFEVEGGRVKRKELELKSKITDHDFEFQIPKIIKWLQKENFVAVKIKFTSDTNSEDAERLRDKIMKEVENNKDILGEKATRLSISIGK